MPLLFLLLALAVVAVVVALLTGRLEAHLSPAVTSRPLTGLPGGELEGRDVENLRFTVGLRGYRMDEVDDALDRLRDEISRLRAELGTRDAEIARHAAPSPGAPAAEPHSSSPDPDAAP